MHHWVLSWRMSATTRIQSKKRLWGHLSCVFTLWLRRLTRVDWMSSVWSHDWYCIQGYRVMCWHPVKPWYFHLARCLPRESPYQVPTMPSTQILSIQRLTRQHRIMSAGHRLGVHSHSFNWHLWTKVSGNPPENAPLGIGGKLGSLTCTQTCGARSGKKKKKMLQVLKPFLLNSQLEMMISSLSTFHYSCIQYIFSQISFKRLEQEFMV